MSDADAVDSQVQPLDGAPAAEAPQKETEVTARGTSAIFMAERRQRLLLAVQALPAWSARNVLVWVLAAASFAGLVLGAVWLERYRGTPGLEAKRKARIAEARQHVLADVLAARAQLDKEGIVSQDPKRAGQMHAMRQSQQERQRPGVAAQKPAATRPVVPKPPVKTLAQQQSEAYFASYGNYRGGNGWLFQQVKADKAKTQGQSRHGGRLLPAELTGAVSSTAGDVAIARLTRDVVLGTCTLPRGTEVHGTANGASSEGDLLYINFHFIRLATGGTYDIQGTALGVSGRSGIPGKRRLTRQTADSVVLASMAEMAAPVGQSIAGVAGQIVGKGVEGGVQSGSRKAQRIDRDESVVTVLQGAKFNVYLVSAELP